MAAFDALVREGKVRYIGISNWRAWQVMKANGIAKLHNYSPIVSIEPRYNLLFRMIEEELVPMAEEEGLAIISYNPLAGGLLTGRYKGIAQPEKGTRFGLENRVGALYQKRYWQKAIFLAVETYINWCEENSLNPTTTAVRWVMQQKGITSVILGASRPDQFDSALAASDMTPLDNEQLAWLDQLWYSLPRRNEYS